MLGAVRQQNTGDKQRCDDQHSQAELPPVLWAPWCVEVSQCILVLFLVVDTLQVQRLFGDQVSMSEVVPALGLPEGGGEVVCAAVTVPDRSTRSTGSMEGMEGMEVVWYVIKLVLSTPGAPLGAPPLEVGMHQRVCIREAQACGRKGDSLTCTRKCTSAIRILKLYKALALEARTLPHWPPRP